MILSDNQAYKEFCKSQGLELYNQLEEPDLLDQWLTKERWFWGAKTPLEMIEMGRLEQVINYLKAMLAGEILA